MYSKSKRGKFRNNQNKNARPYHRDNQHKKEYRHCEQLLEKEVGINEFISKHDGFNGIIKARFSDFQVHEINLQGEVAKLTDTNIPKDFSLKMVKFDFKEVDKSPNENIPQETWEAIKNIAVSPNSDPVTLDVDSLSKETRKEIHVCVKSHFGRKVISSTIRQDGKQLLQFKKFNKDEKCDERLEWPADKGEYVHFILYKEKIDTMEACMRISGSLKMSPSRFTHAGTKDRRSITTQWFSVKKLEPWKLFKAAKNHFNIKIGNFTFKDEPLRLGQLQGNMFKIALRNITSEDEVISRCVSHVKENGFINYYGLQRFGNDKEVPTFQIGVKLLQGKWKEAIQLILKPKASDDPGSAQADIVEAKKIYAETGDAAKAYAVAERNRTGSVELRLLEGLKKNNDGDYVNALENIPRPMRLLYLHSFQSMIWNNMVSKRLQLFGMECVEGDLVLTSEQDDKMLFSESVENNDDDEDAASEAPEDGATSFKCRKDVKALTAEDLSKYSIHDVVLPLPGYNIIYPENLKRYYKEALEEYELTLEMTKQKVRSYNLCGDYRKILERVKDLSWKTMKYNNHTDNLIRSDFQELKGDPEPVSIEGGKYKALILEFGLTSSSYATMVLREIMKCETSSFVHSQMNDYYEKTGQKNNTVKIVVDNNTGEEQQNEGSDLAKTSSLLSNPERYEEFKNSIFNSVNESLKRGNADAEHEENNKKLKKEESERIKTQASLI